MLRSTRTSALAGALVTTVALVLTTLIGWTGAATAVPAPPPDRKGPVGWDTYRNMDRISTVPTGVETKQFSSFDRTGGNEDGFAGVYSCLRTAADGCVIAEATGAGEVESIWFTRDEGNVSRTGNLKVELDGATVLDAPLQDLVDGKRGAPFVFPFVANADQSSGGVYVKVPMPYRSRMRVTTTNNPLFYHVTYRSFADARGVSTFDASYVPQDVIAAAQTWGTKDPKPARATTRQSASFSLAPGQTTQLAQVKGAGELTQLRLQVPQVVGPPQLPLIADDGRADKGYTEFTVKVDPANQGVQLTRRFDANSNHQVADIYVDGVKVGQWPATDDAPGYWSYQTVTLPASATAGKSSITVRNVFVSASIDWNEFHYWVDSIVNGAPVRTDELDVGTSLAALASEQAHAYSITNQTWTGTPNQTDRPSNPQDPAVLASNEILRDVYVRVSFDGQPTVESPLGEFFHTGLTESPVRSLFANVDTSPQGWYTSWWPMPYAKSAVVELVNRSSQTVSAGNATVDSAVDKEIGRQLTERDPSIGYFNATHRRGDAVTGQDWAFLDTAGTGRFVGVSQTVHGEIPAGNIREYLEGDERVYVDGAKTPSIHGTGTEDFYESGWYFNRGAFTNPMNGATAMPARSFGCQYQCDSPYRLMIGDAVPFRSSITFGIEHGPVDNAAAEYSSTAYWYGFANQAGARVTDTLDLGDAASRAAHGYVGPAATTPLTATYEGDHDDLAVSDTVSSATGGTSFQALLDPNATAVTLRRTSDQNVGYQSAQVSVDGVPAGTWLEPLENSTHRWLDDTFQIDPSLTNQKRKVTIAITPTAGAPAWTASAYAVLSARPPSTDHKAPSAVSGLVATGTESNAIRLSWNAATDDVGVDHYEIYGAVGATVTPSTATLIGTSTLPSFVHNGIGLNQTWTYVVRAVDAAGNTGGYSNPATATSGSTLRVEGESLLPPVSSTAPAVVQGNCCGVSWSGGAQLWFQAAKAGDTVTVRFSVPQDGSYALTAALTKAADYGITQVAVDGTPVGAPFDGYQPAGVAVTDHPLGTRTLTAGAHTLTLTVTNRNAAAIGWLAGLDVLSLRLA